MPRKPKPVPRRRRGSGSLTILRDGTIRARLPAGPDGRRTAREFRADHLAEAQAWLDAQLHPEAAETTAPVTLREWAGVWLGTYVLPIRPSTTARRYRHSLRLLEPLYTVSLAELRPSALQALAGQLSARLAASTVQDAIGVWRRCLDAAVDDELIARNPARRLVLPAASPTGTGRHVTPAEVALLWPAIRGHRFEAGYALLLGCGLRIGEVLGLHWQYVELDAGRAWITHQWTDHQMRPLPKGRNPHWAHLPPRVVAALRRQRDAQPDDVLVMQSPHRAQRRKGRPASKEPRPWSYETVRADLVAVCRAAGLTPFAPHATRRGLVSALFDGGASPAVVAERVGHASPATSLRHYAAVNPDARQAADALIDRYLGGPLDGDSGTKSERSG